MRILHISDLHCGVAAVTDQAVLVAAMLKDVSRLAAKTPVDLVVFTGDLAGRGRADEFDHARELLLDPLSANLHLPPERIILVPGNHDIDRELVSEFLEPGLRLLKTPEEVDRLVCEADDFGQAIRRVESWRTFRDGYYPAGTSSAPNPLCWVHRFAVEGAEVGVAVLDSSWRATGAPDDGDKLLLIIGPSQALEALDAIDDCEVRIVAFHHPLGWLAPWSHAFLREELEHRGTVVLTGHEHMADPVMEKSARGSAVYSKAGCLYQGRDFPNGYSVIDIDTRDRDLTMGLRSWMKGRRVFDAAIELAEHGLVPLTLPERVGKGLITLPKYTTVTSSLACLAQSRSLFSGQLAQEEPTTVDDVVVEPRLYRAPYGQIAAAVGIVKSRNRRIEQMKPVNPLAALDEGNVLILAGDAESGVTNALIWILQQQYSRDAERVPAYLPYEIHPGKDPFDKDVRAGARQMAVNAGPRDALPPLIIAFDDVTGVSEKALKRLSTYIKDHPENLYVLGCHGDNFRDIRNALEGDHMMSTVAFVGPFGRRQTVQLMELAGLDCIAEDVNRVLKVVFDENLPRSPFVLAALVTVLAASPESKPPNVSTLLDAVIDLLLGKSDPSDREAGMDSRDREHILEVLAGNFTLTGSWRLPRADAEEFLDTYFKDRGIERSVSPGHVLDSLIRRKILVDGVDGVGFRHSTLQHILAAKYMLEDGDFNARMRLEPMKYSEIIRHAAALRRTEKSLLDLVGRTTNASMLRAIGECDGLFDQLLGPGTTPMNADALDRRIEAVGPRPDHETELALDEYFDQREAVESFPSPWDGLPPQVLESMHGTAFLSLVLAGSELVDDVDMKTMYLKQALMAWGSVAEILGARTDDWEPLRGLFEDAFPETNEARREAMWALFVRVSVIFSTAVSMSEIMGSAGLGTAIKRLAEDDEIMSSPTYSLYLTVLFTELNLDGYIDQLSKTFARHHRHLFLADLTTTIALSRYVSPATSDSDAQKLLNFLSNARVNDQTGRHGVERRSKSRSDVQARLRQERARHRDDMIGEGLVEDILGLKEGDEGSTEPNGGST